MRTSLLNPLRAPRHTRRQRRGRGAPQREPVRDAMPDARQTELRRVDLDVQRVREAGGPVDLAFYTCGCGYLFDASVSTTVMCPHCGADQAW